MNEKSSGERKSGTQHSVPFCGNVYVVWSLVVVIPTIAIATAIVFPVVAPILHRLPCWALWAGRFLVPIIAVVCVVSAVRRWTSK